jgi:aspartate-semialdehyde dehydrogenase
MKQVLEDRNFPVSDLILLDESPLAGTLTEAAGEPTFIRSLDEDSFDHVDFAFFAGTASAAEQNWLTAQRAGATVIDLTGAVAASGRGTAWIPAVAHLFPPRPASGANGSTQPAAYSSPATPVIVACTLTAGLGRFMPQRIAVLFFPPVSERDQAGVEELESQTRNLLLFREIAKPVFDAQVAFNLLAQYGEASKPCLEDVRRAIARDVAQILAGRALVPAIQLVQAPVFYGYAFDAYAEFASPKPLEQLATAFANLWVKISTPADPAPTNVSVAGESEILFAPIASDPSVAAGVWIWGMADNLRLAATNAVRIAEGLLAA